MRLELNRLTLGAKGRVAGALALFALIGVTACGGSTESSTALVGQRAAMDTGGTDATVSSAKAREVPAGGCGRAIVRLGPSAGAIDYRLTCMPEGSKAARFVVARDGRPKERAGVIVRFRQRPPLVQGGSIQGYGRCTRRRAELGCSVRGSGRISVWGRIWVPVGSQCESHFEVIEPVLLQSCQGDCPSGEVVREIASVYPKGC